MLRTRKVCAQKKSEGQLRTLGRQRRPQRDISVLLLKATTYFSTHILLEALLSDKKIRNTLIFLYLPYTHLLVRLV